MQTVDIRAAKTNLSRLLDAAAAGEEIIITRAGQPVARLVALLPAEPPPAPKARRKLGGLAGKITIPPDFDDPLPDDLLDLFEGR